MKVRFDARRSPTAAGAALVAMALAAGLSGCTSGDPEAAPGVAVSEVAASPSPSPVDPAEAAKEERIADAQRRYEEYQEITTRLSKKGEDPFWELMDNGYLSGDEFRKYQQSVWGQLTEQGIRKTGDTVVLSYDNVKYEGDPLDEDIALHEVSMDVCLDNTDVDFVKPNGDSILEDGYPKRVLQKVVMRGMPAGVWALAVHDSDGVAC